VGNAAKIDAFGTGAGSAQPEFEAYRQRLKKRTDLLLAGGHVTPTPSDMEVAGLEDDYHSDTDDEVYWGDEDAIDDDDDYNYDGQSEVYSTPVAMVPASGLPWSASPASAPSPQGGFGFFAGFGGGTSPMPQPTPGSVFGAGPVIRRSDSSSSDSSSDSSSGSDDEVENARYARQTRRCLTRV
jgi:hypothetical protein